MNINKFQLAKPMTKAKEIMCLVVYLGIILGLTIRLPLAFSWGWIPGAIVWVIGGIGLFLWSLSQGNTIAFSFGVGAGAILSIPMWFTIAAVNFVFGNGFTATPNKEEKLKW